MKKVLGALVATCFLNAAGSGQGAVIFELTSDANASTAQNVAPGVLVTGYTRGSGLTVFAGETFNSSGFTTNGAESDAVDNGDFITWGFTSTTALHLTSFDIRYDRSGTGPASLRIDLNAGSGFSEVFRDPAVSATSEDNLAISLASFTNVTSATFRLVGWGASSTGGTFDFENAPAISSPASSFQLHGELAAVSVPEPAFVFILSTASGVASAARFRRQRKWGL